MIDLPQLKNRVARLADLTRKLGKEVEAWKARLGTLLPQEQLAYLRGIQDTLAALDAARVTLTAVVRRMEGKTGADG
jgi:hypothetical protein